ncbi:muramidase [Lactobacillus sp. LC28-10]|uniref:Muramidase n=1 Tax=Secundilactobacillus angelensis TaxID=2722706 RepID=A0ABX1KWT3_9LACO|nr:glucosaminidase domain-containing protein [Secundilactobacillus angelensis]MCH5462142.1 glucosaminidase domain-containing protein [Secundilactobacillus angelensis]NLR18377.1 muramidase [Secundilactobacillus angelensis]
MRKQWMVGLLTVGLVVCGLTGVGHTRAEASTTADTFISNMSSPVKKVADQYKLYPSVMMAQAALESGWGTSQLTINANNYFGIKGSYNGASVTMSTAEYNANGQLYYTQAAFKKYPDAAASMTDNAQLLRNGTAWNPNYYSGTWRENAPTYESAANALTGTYATAPNYGSSLINLIQTYKFYTLDGSTSSAESATPSQKPVVDTTKVNYYIGSNSQTATLGSKYKGYALYNHVKGSKYKTTKYSWSQIGGWQGRPVWIDARGYKVSTKTNWYRVRFSKQTTSKKYWVYSKALSFPKTTYKADKKSVTLNGTIYPVYDHVFNSTYIAKQLTTTKALTNHSVTIDKKATHVQNGVTTTWYRIHSSSLTGWVSSLAIKK